MSMMQAKTRKRRSPEPAADTFPFDELNQDLLERVLSRLPPSSFFRLRSVCRRWNTAGSSAAFRRACSEVQSRDPWFLMVGHDLDQSIVFDTSEGNWKNLTHPILLQQTQLSKSIPVASSGGLVCFRTPAGQFVVCNPIAGACRELPPLGQACDSQPLHAIAMISSTENRAYRVVLVLGELPNLEVMVFDSEKNQWEDELMVRKANVNANSMESSDEPVTVYFLSKAGDVVATNMQRSPSKQYSSVALAMASALLLSLIAITLISLPAAFFQDHITAALRQRAQLARPLKKLTRPTVILVSLDGFKFGYQFKTPTPNIHRLIAEGTEASLGLYPVFPSISIPNHYSMATGLYPASSGVINFIFFDPVSNQTFVPSNHDPRLWLGEPIWETASKQGFPAAAVYWAGGEVKKGSWTCPPKFCPKYSSHVPLDERVDAVLGYMDLPADEIPVVTALYVTEPDEQGHKWGPDHPDITDAVAAVDRMLGRLVAGLEERGVYDDVSLIVLGDHGMVTTCDNKYVFLEDLAPWIEIPHEWLQFRYQLVGIQPPPGVDPAGVLAKIRLGLGSGNVTNGGMVEFHLKEDLPARFHYSDSERISPIIGLVAEGYSAVLSRSEGAECAGVHGYDNMLYSMRSIFVARGPQFAEGRKIPSFVNVEVYNLITTILGLKAAPNNGTAAFAKSVLLPTA